MNSRYRRGKGQPDYDQDGYEAQGLYYGESALIIGSTVRVGGKPPPQHMHEHCDQLYYVTQGEMQIQFGADLLSAGAETLVYIPQGTPHHNWNAGDVDEFHFEVLAPAPWIMKPLVTLTDSTELGGRKPFVRPLAEVGMTEAMPGFSNAWVLNRDDGSESMSLYVAQMDPGGSGPDLHVHDFDQFYYVLEGELTVEVAFERFTAERDDLVVLPAGVPHRQWNEGEARERHLTLLAPEPVSEGDWDTAVEFSAAGSEGS